MYYKTAFIYLFQLKIHVSLQEACLLQFLLKVYCTFKAMKCDFLKTTRS